MSRFVPTLKGSINPFSIVHYPIDDKCQICQMLNEKWKMKGFPYSCMPFGFEVPFGWHLNWSF